MADRFHSTIQADPRSPARRFWDDQVVWRYDAIRHNDVFNLPVQMLTGVRMDDPATPGNLAAAALSLAPLGRVATTARAAKGTIGQWWAGKRLAKATDRLAVLEARSAEYGDTIKRASKMLEAKTFTAGERAAIRQARTDATLAKAGMDRKVEAARDLATRRALAKTEADVVAGARAERAAAKKQIRELRSGRMTVETEGSSWWNGVVDHVMNHKWSYGIGGGVAAVAIPGTIVQTASDNAAATTGTAQVKAVQTDVDKRWNTTTNDVAMAEAMSDVNAARKFVRGVKTAMDYQRANAPKDKDGNMFFDDYRRSVEVSKAALAPLMKSSIWKKLEEQSLSAYAVDATPDEKKSREALEAGWRKANPHPVDRVLPGFDRFDPEGKAWNGTK